MARRDPLLATLILVAAVLPPLFGLFGGGDDRGPAMTVFWLAMSAIHGSYAVLTRRIAGLLVGDDPLLRGGRRLWRLISMAAVLWAAGDLSQVAYALGSPGDRAIVMGTPFFMACMLGGMALALTGALTFPGGTRSGLRMDVATVMAAAITAGCLLIELPPGPHNSSWVLTLIVTLLVAPGVFLLAAFAVLRITLTSRHPVTLAAAVCNGLATLLQALMQAVPLPVYLNPRTGAWLLAGTLLANMLLLIGGRVQHQVDTVRFRRRGERPYSLLPYAAMAVTWIAGVGLLAAEGLTWRSWLVIAGSMVTTGLVVARQAVAFRHIAVLLVERDALAAKLTEQAFHDALTGLANRALFMRELTDTLSRTEVTVFLIDLDEFKPVNDRFGHATGDRLLIEVGRRLRRCVRAGDVVARLGGDEFAVLMTDLDPARRAEVEAVLTAELTGLVTLEGMAVPLRASIGTATGRHDADSLLHEADMAMYAVKNAARTVLRP
jgi:diguanylate cyclase (GGDEF)-like protein